MKKIKKYISIVLIFVMIVVSSSVFAHSVDLDTEGRIVLPNSTSNGEAVITINEDEDYTMFFQWIEISEQDYDLIEDLVQDLEDYISINEPILNDKKDISDQAEATWLAEYAIDPNSEATQTAYTASMLALNDYNNFRAEYEDTVADFTDDIKALKPMYVEVDWIEAINNTAEEDLASFAGDKFYVLWIKIETAGDTYYNEGTYILGGTFTPDIDVTSIVLSTHTLSLEVGENETLTIVISPEDATNKNVIWESSDEDVATVVDGVVTAVGVGTATITVTTEDGDFTDTCEVTVVEATATDPDPDDEEPEVKDDEDDTKAPVDRLPNAGKKIVIPSMILTLAGVAVTAYKKQSAFGF